MMIWLFLGGLVWATLLCIGTPLYRRSGFMANSKAEVRAYLEEIKDLENQIDIGDDEASNLLRRKTELERQIADSSGRGFAVDNGPPVRLLIALFVIFTAAAFGIYFMIGRADLA